MPASFAARYATWFSLLDGPRRRAGTDSSGGGSQVSRPPSRTATRCPHRRPRRDRDTTRTSWSRRIPIPLAVRRAWPLASIARFAIATRRAVRQNGARAFEGGREIIALTHRVEKFLDDSLGDRSPEPIRSPALWRSSLAVGVMNVPRAPQREAELIDFVDPMSPGGRPWPPGPSRAGEQQQGRTLDHARSCSGHQRDWGGQAVQAADRAACARLAPSSRWSSPSAMTAARASAPRRPT